MEQLRLPAENFAGLLAETVGTRNQGDQDVRAGEVFVKYIEEAALPGFEFSGHGEMEAG